MLLSNISNQSYLASVSADTNTDTNSEIESGNILSNDDTVQLMSIEKRILKGITRVNRTYKGKE